ncbi:hypothetical protein Dsin_002225 [Dipteronia sinensis]|uniref:Uncharacterized protein n=1 Tax=Dipteronia sinensis TaxID=43782 RepID=A0AAE0B733_9ROSI|nr:hypothetical protein Dsin_002225 [Dipteronia sinensis]
MANSICQDLTESGEEENDYYCLKDDDADESQFIYVINAILGGTARLNVLLPTATILAFTIFAPLLTNDGSHSDIVACYYPAMPRKITNTVPLVVGFVISILFVVFPSKRRGIGYPFLLQRDALYSRC